MSAHIKNLTITVQEFDHKKVLVKDLSLDIPKETIVGLVGGSGSGKTTTGLSLLRLLPLALDIEHGSILLDDENLLEASEERMRQLRGKEISMVFQEPLNAFNPVFTIGSQIDEMLVVHTDLSQAQRQNKILDLLELVGIPDPIRIANNYPHQLSGGLRQRAMIAQAIAVDPKLIIADEPTSNLDVTLQARIMELFRKLKDELNLSVLLITHDLGMVKHLADRVAVMTKGEIVEEGEINSILESPSHMYTQKLMNALEV